MRRWPLLILVLLAACSQGTPTHSDAGLSLTSPDAASDPAGDPTARTSGSDPQIGQPSPAAHEARTAAASNLHRYLQLLVQGDRRGSDAFWSGGKPPPQPDDAVLRAMTDIRTLRVDNQAAIALDQEDPPRSLEIPVRLRLGTSQGNRILLGWYRMRPRVDGTGWEITSASLQPAID
ncbi:hypothetical protein [Stenotrophomonas sp. Marseille-Q4652]|uniref:hypothetical protein n=1 Tax=Stenotrophomonas sp. Marseille-Q4652 TaxID=2866595 RepID=UPI001CE3E1DA|nr:hypothetical protein [Stenotrophomonas sp. Marseille-Q4652]